MRLFDLAKWYAASFYKDLDLKISRTSLARSENLEISHKHCFLWACSLFALKVLQGVFFFQLYFNNCFLYYFVTSKEKVNFIEVHFLSLLPSPDDPDALNVEQFALLIEDQMRILASFIIAVFHHKYSKRRPLNK